MRLSIGAPQHRLNRRQRIGSVRVIRVGSFPFDNERAITAMNAGISRIARHNAKRWIQQVDRLNQRLAFSQVPQVHHLAGCETASNIAPEERGDRPTNEHFSVARGLDHREVNAVDNQHRPVRQDSPGNLDGFNVTIREVNNLHVTGPHDADTVGNWVAAGVAFQSSISITKMCAGGKANLPPGFSGFYPAPVAVMRRIGQSEKRQTFMGAVLRLSSSSR